MIPVEAVEAAHEQLEAMGAYVSRDYVEAALEAAAPHMFPAAPLKDEARYVDIIDPMWEEHQRTVSPKCTCDYTKIQNGLWKTIAIRRTPDKECATHE